MLSQETAATWYSLEFIGTPLTTEVLSHIQLVLISRAYKLNNAQFSVQPSEYPSGPDASLFKGILLDMAADSLVPVLSGTHSIDSICFLPKEYI